MIKKAYFLPLLLALLSVFCCNRVAAQYLAPKFAIHFTNPLGLGSKGGIYGQYRLNQQNSFLLGYKWYWGFFPGYQATTEYHRYFWSWDKSEAFYYVKAGIGQAGYNPKPYFSGWDDPYKSPDGYIFGGAGAGKRYNFGHFFMEFNVGLKFTQLQQKRPTVDYNYNLFHSLGPGSFVDINFHLGYQFYNEDRQLYLRNLRSHWPRRYK